MFPLAVLNRETACFLSVFFVVWEWVRLAKSDIAIKSRLLRIAPHALVQAAIWIAIKIGPRQGLCPQSGRNRIGGRRSL